MTKHQFDFLTAPQQLNLVESGSYIGSSKVEGVDASLFLTKGNYWVEVFYEEDGETINFMGLCPDHRLTLYVEGHDLADIL
jgi:hypothetical protein